MTILVSDFGFDTVSAQDQSEQKNFPRILHDNGMLHLVLHGKYMEYTKNCCTYVKVSHNMNIRSSVSLLHLVELVCFVLTLSQS